MLGFGVGRQKTESQAFFVASLQDVPMLGRSLMLGLYPLGRLLLEGHAGFYPGDACLGLISRKVLLAIFLEYKASLFQAHGLVDEVRLC